MQITLVLTLEFNADAGNDWWACNEYRSFVCMDGRQGGGDSCLVWKEVRGRSDFRMSHSVFGACPKKCAVQRIPSPIVWPEVVELSLW